MRSIMLVNAKGGCGKSTLATNLASFYATRGKNVTLVDMDPQGSSYEWVNNRPEDRPGITAIAGWKEPFRPSRDTEVLIIDTAAGTEGKELTALARKAETILVPVLPSTIDMRAAKQFLYRLLLMGRIEREETRVAVVANRVRENTLIYEKLNSFLRKLDIPFVATLRDTQNYIRADERGLGIFELAPSSVYWDLEQWKKLTRYLNSQRSLPG
ncbi:MAG: nucleotide-binding protein [Acidiferrobacterales bacterium]